jgi:hypothetical protein
MTDICVLTDLEASEMYLAGICFQTECTRLCRMCKCSRSSTRKCSDMKNQATRSKVTHALTHNRVRVDRVVLRLLSDSYFRKLANKHLLRCMQALQHAFLGNHNTDMHGSIEEVRCLLVLRFCIGIDSTNFTCFSDHRWQLQGIAVETNLVLLGSVCNVKPFTRRGISAFVGPASHPRLALTIPWFLLSHGKYDFNACGSGSDSTEASVPPNHASQCFFWNDNKD